MDRRKFIKRVSYTGAGAVVLGGIPVNVMANSKAAKLAAGSVANNDNVLVFIQLHGGNDALNSLIPVSQYDEYYDLRSNIAIPESGTRSYINVDSSLSDSAQVGLHPDMMGFKDLYDEGKAAIIQNVGYPDMNLSHFRGRDIVFMGGDAYDSYESGWMGRFLDYEYPGYPDSYPSDQMEDPIGLEFSGTLSLAFHREDGIPIGLNVGSPEGFYQLINSVGVDPEIAYPDSHAGDELRYIMEFEKKSNEYADRLKEVYDAGQNSATTYPDAYPFMAPKDYVHNQLAPQLKLIARLLKGGIKTRIFLCRMGGFDTHGEQVERSNPTLGQHSALMYHLSSAVKAFYDDLGAMSIDSKVLSMTFTEFGRRARSNASYGTDHGTSTPVFLFGTGLNAGVYGENPDLNNLANDNLQYEIDYRQIYTSVVQDWFGASDDSMIATGFNEWVGNKLPLISSTGVDNAAYRKNGMKLDVFPNPVKSDFTVQFFMQKQDVVAIKIYNVEGKTVQEKSFSGVFGVNSIQFNIDKLSSGKYIVHVKTLGKTLVGTLIKM